MLSNPDHKSGSESVRKAEAYYIKSTFQEIVFNFLRRTPKYLALASVKMGGLFPNRAEAPRTRAEVPRTWAETPRTRADNFRKRRRAIFLGELCAVFLHPILIIFILRPIGLQAFPAHFHMY